MRAQTDPQVVGLLLLLVSVLLLAPLHLACLRRRRSVASDGDPTNRLWAENIDEFDNLPAGYRRNGPFWPGCGRVEALEEPFRPWPMVLPDENDTVPYTLEELGLEEDYRRSGGGGGSSGHSRGASLKDNVVIGTEFPSHVSIIDNEHGSFDHKCGGVIIADRLVLTTKTCLGHILRTSNFSDMFLFASFRTWNARQTNITWSHMGKIRQVANVCLGVDKSPSGPTRRAEYALIRTTKPFCFNEKIWSACLPDRQYHEKERARFRPHRNLYQVGNGIAWQDAKDKHLRVGYKGVRLTSCHNSEGHMSNFEVCYAEYYNHNRWSRVCRGDVGAGLYVAERNSSSLSSVYNKLTVLSVVGRGNNWRLWAEDYCSIEDYSSGMDWWFSDDIYEELTSGPLKKSIELCGQGLYGYPRQKLEKVNYSTI